MANIDFACKKREITILEFWDERANPNQTISNLLLVFKLNNCIIISNLVNTRSTDQIFL